MTNDTIRAAFAQDLTCASMLFVRLCDENDRLHAALERIMYDHGNCNEWCAKVDCAFRAARPMLRDGWRERQEARLEQE